MLDRKTNIITSHLLLESLKKKKKPEIRERTDWWLPEAGCEWWAKWGKGDKIYKRCGNHSFEIYIFQTFIFYA